MDNAKSIEEEIENVHSVAMHREDTEQTAEGSGSGSGSGGSGGEEGRALGRIKHKMQRHSLNVVPSVPRFLHHDPDDYLHAKKKLKKAVMECYR